MCKFGHPRYHKYTCQAGRYRLKVLHPSWEEYHEPLTCLPSSAQTASKPNQSHHEDHHIPRPNPPPNPHLRSPKPTTTTTTRCLSPGTHLRRPRDHRSAGLRVLQDADRPRQAALPGSHVRGHRLPGRAGGAVRRQREGRDRGRGAADGGFCREVSG